MNFLQYLWDKLPELSQLGGKDFQLGKLVARIHRKRSQVVSACLPLCQIQSIHVIDRGTALERVAARGRAVQQVRESWSALPFVSRDHMEAVLPSVSAIKVIKMSAERYIAFEGNGRLYALKQYFNDLLLEVDLYVMAADDTVVRRVERVLSLNGLSKG